MAYNNEPIMPNKFLKPDGSIVTFDGAEVYPPSDKYADIYRQMQWQAAKWLLPDGSIVAALPIYTEALDRLYVPLTRKININIIPVPEKITLQLPTSSIPAMQRCRTQSHWLLLSAKKSCRRWIKSTSTM